MKKKMRLLALLCVVLLLLTACAGSFFCDLCGRESTGRKNKRPFMGEELTICNQCEKELNQMADELMR